MNKFFFSDFEISVLEGVYEPREDSELLAGVLEKSKLQGSDALDMGCGSGIHSIVLAKKGFNVTSVDVNDHALENVKLNSEKLKLRRKIHPLRSDLFGNVSGKFDVIVFNPPYVESEKLKWKEIDGGKKGRKILDRFLEEFDDYLSVKGICFFLQSSLNGIGGTEEILNNKKMNFEIAGRKKLFFEELIVFKVSKH